MEPATRVSVLIANSERGFLEGQGRGLSTTLYDNLRTSELFNFV